MLTYPNVLYIVRTSLSKENKDSKKNLNRNCLRMKQSNKKSPNVGGNKVVLKKILANRTDADKLKIFIDSDTFADTGNFPEVDKFSRQITTTQPLCAANICLFWCQLWWETRPLRRISRDLGRKGDMSFSHNHFS